MRSIKKSLDPYWLMNPGKIFEAVPVDKPDDSIRAVASSSLAIPKAEI